MPPVRIDFDARRPWREVRLPGSKSIAARALVCRYVQDAGTRLENLPDCDDTRELREALRVLDEAAPHAVRLVKEDVEIPPTRIAVNLGNGGTTLRFFLALAASIPGLTAEICCGEGLGRRPLAPLVDELRRHGASIDYLLRDGYPPLLVRGRRLTGGPILVPRSLSSQFVSALLLASPLWKGEVRLENPPEVSAPYVDMTRRVMEQFAARPERYKIEADWSAASYFYEVALALPGRALRIASLPLAKESLQGDALCHDFFGWLGVTTRRLDVYPQGAVELMGDVRVIDEMKRIGVPVMFDLRHVPDLTPALAVALCMARMPFRFDALPHLRVKECDRLAALSVELSKAGYAVHDEGDSLRWDGRLYPVNDDEALSAWDDHRMAMALAPLAIRKRWLAIEGARVVTKSFPDFYRQLENVGFGVRLKG